MHISNYLLIIFNSETKFSAIATNVSGTLMFFNSAFTSFNLSSGAGNIKHKCKISANREYIYLFETAESNGTEVVNIYLL